MPTPNKILEELLIESRAQAEDITTFDKDISCIPELKIAFDGYGEDEETGELSDKNNESYVIYIAKGADKDGFVYAEHEAKLSGTENQFCAYAWLELPDQNWVFTNLDYPEESSKLSYADIEEILSKLYSKYFE